MPADIIWTVAGSEAKRASSEPVTSALTTSCNSASGEATEAAGATGRATDMGESLISEPAGGTTDRPIISTGSEGGADARLWPSESSRLRTLPISAAWNNFWPIVREPFLTITTAVEPVWGLRRLSKTTASRGPWGSATGGWSWASKPMMYNRSGIPAPVLAEMATLGTSPPKSSTITACSVSWVLTLSGSADLTSDLVIATTYGIPDDLIKSMDCRVCGWTPSSAATTKTARSAIFDPRERMAEKASCPGVSMKVMGGEAG